ncbi:MAG: hypothetical protein IM592_01370 [Bacteroidetes bacterium]|nr:hypothetical protein [Bacteroidota bacterium]
MKLIIKTIFLTIAFNITLHAQISVMGVVKHVKLNLADTNNSIQITPLNGSSPFSYNWTPGNINSQNLLNVARNNYQVVVTDNNFQTGTYGYSIGYKTDWFHLTNINFTNDSLKPSTSATGNKAAISKNSLPKNTNGWSELIMQPYSDPFVLGFVDSIDVANLTNMTNVEFALHVTVYNSYYAWSNGTWNYLGAANTGDVLRLQRMGAVYSVLKNGVTMFTATANPNKKLKLKVILNNTASLVNIGTSFKDTSTFDRLKVTPTPIHVEPNGIATKGTLNADIKGGRPPYSYLWTPGNFATKTVNNVNPGIYKLRVIDADNDTAYTKNFNLALKTYYHYFSGTTYKGDSLIMDNNVSNYGYNPSAYSQNELKSGSLGFSEIILQPFNHPYIYGFMPSNSINAPGLMTDIEFAMHITYGNALYAWANGYWQFLTYTNPNDVVKIGRGSDEESGNYYLTLNGVNLITVNADLNKKLRMHALITGDPLVNISNNYWPDPNAPPMANFDLTLNWQQELTYDESGNVIGSNKTYLDNLGRSTQSLAKNNTNQVFTSQTVYDSYGRPALNTLPAYTGNQLVYQQAFLKNQNGLLYDYTKFDTPGTINNPVSFSTDIDKTLGFYYSNNNGYDTRQATTAYPYARTVYNADPTSSAKKISQPGEAYKTGSGKESYSFTMPSGDELNYFYNIGGNQNSYKVKVNSNDVLNSTQINLNENMAGQKVVSISPDNKESITYQSNGKTVVTCLSNLSGGLAYNMVDRRSLLYYQGTKSTDIHLPVSKKNTLYLELPQHYYYEEPGVVGGTFNTGANDIIYKITNLYTDEVLQEGTDYNVDGSRNVIFSSGLLNQYNDKGLVLRISFDYTPAFLSYLATNNAEISNASVKYSLDYGQVNKNYYDLGGALRKTSSPKAFNPGSEDAFCTTFDYNHLGQLIASKHPDQGTTEILHNDKGLLKYSQTAQQKTENKFSYVNYDKHNRVVETGEYTTGSGANTYWFNNYYGLGNKGSNPGTYVGNIVNQIADALVQAEKSNTVTTLYTVPVAAEDIPNTYTYFNQYRGFKNGMVNRIKNANSTVWFNYDAAGRSKATITQITESDFVMKNSGIDNQIKTSQSNYNYFTGLVNSSTYQLNNSNEKLQYNFTYDANYRQIGSSLNYGTKTENLTSTYYNIMGQPYRNVLGNKLQGIDFVYTLNGQLKAINHPGLSPELDPGADDGDYAGTDIKKVNQDLFGEIIEYHTNDYVRAGSHYTTSILTGSSNQKYNGLIATTRFKTRSVVNGINNGMDYINYMGGNQTQLINGLNYQNKELAFTYTYDELNRLGTSSFATYNNYLNTASLRNEYTEQGAGGNIGYDKNGNLTRLVRNAYANETLDDLTYTNAITGNKLTAIVDAAVNNYPLGFNFKTPSNINTSPFVYNNNGQLTQSTAEGLSNISYLPNGQVKQISFSNGNTTVYEYDAEGKKLKARFYNAGTNQYKYTWYIGPYLFEYDESQNNPQLLIAEARLSTGILKVNSNNVNNAYPVYQLTDHLGNVRVTFKPTGSNNAIEVLSVSDYYTFGGNLPGRQWQSQAYRYGYQGQEKTTDAGNPWYQFELRMYNQDIARWFAPDPYAQFVSPYVAMGNNPVSGVDPDGGWVNAAPAEGRRFLGQEQDQRDRANQSGAYSAEWVNKRYNNEYESLKKAYFSGSSRDVEGFLNAVMELNAQYAGLAKTGAATPGMQNGQDALTENEMASVQHLLREVNTSVVKSWRQGEQESEAIANAVGSMQSLARFLEEHQNTLERRAGTYSHTSKAGEILRTMLKAFSKPSKMLEFEEEQVNERTGTKYTNGSNFNDGLTKGDVKNTKDPETTVAQVPDFVFQLVGTPGVKGTLVNSNLLGGNFTQIEIEAFVLMRPDGGSGITYNVNIIDNNTGNSVFSQQFLSTQNGNDRVDLRTPGAPLIFNSGNFNYSIIIQTTRSDKGPRNGINYYDGCYNLGIGYRVTR